ncbi:hypothetical protein J1N35_021745 [Gossypium stocksii]|uniref:Uncharacterized protein n=1 Tax=Gossypium stocksii TaxID=47602 RepID=A0A9D4A2S4_9ROSI|nr:hypothetical protein J1N35_021745 [Gossypium stocksii]
MGNIQPRVVTNYFLWILLLMNLISAFGELYRKLKLNCSPGEHATRPYQQLGILLIGSKMSNNNASDADVTETDLHALPDCTLSKEVLYCQIPSPLLNDGFETAVDIASRI